MSILLLIQCKNDDRLTKGAMTIHSLLLFILLFRSCGYYHTAFVTEEGKLLVCGSNETRQLGRKMPPENASPAVVSLPGRVKDVACGHNHTVVLTENGEVYTCGQFYSMSFLIL